MSVTSQDGRPGAGMSIRIRGGGSITQSNDPLFIVDGVQVSGIDDIPADNIESIDVLKMLLLRLFMVLVVLTV